MKILYFAWLRERLDRAEEEIELPPGVTTVGELIAHLRTRDEVTDAAFERPHLIRAALDTELVEHDAPLGSARTLALFPPMTGG
ncbi:molybdopterin converting factor subunit 1 [Arsenicitalea aurantiaca]|uniref:Molybdopterin converting factor subunit 1 n=1 Tax=Arsenicitalea aurantiaca TaxID=1783274 RepID=A0A433XLT2_9HYPH|nr:molybdopterin converting factor subunit 1 [Arsenicitalea aurantiaca]RUT34974.1 molybdopterin converting factor subunit 1 [Arsenicitalea aurantiaca]